MNCQSATLLIPAAISWTPFETEAIVQPAAHNFRRRMCLSNRTPGTDAAELAGEVLDKVLPLFRPAWGEAELTIDSIDHRGVMVGGKLIAGGAWAARLMTGDHLMLYCLSSGCRLAELHAACGNDPVLAATAHLLGSEVIFEATRQYDRRVRGLNQAGRHWRKFAMMTGENTENMRCRWDPAAGASFFRAFAGNTERIRMTEAGSFDPIHSVLGIFHSPNFKGEGS